MLDASARSTANVIAPAVTTAGASPSERSSSLKSTSVRITRLIRCPRAANEPAPSPPLAPARSAVADFSASAIMATSVGRGGENGGGEGEVVISQPCSASAGQGSDSPGRR